MTASLVLHGHFYQPPREDPWTDEIRRQPNAAPWHDWNERIADESYDPLARAGAFEGLSFDVGPTLLQWLERARPETYAAVLEGDRVSRARTGHGNALAQPYHHIILPLASRAEKRRELRWGIQDFERRFGRAPEGMWLPETAVDHETLEVLAELEIAFTVLAPGQVEDAPPDGRPGWARAGTGRVAVFVYDGGLSHGVAFGELLRDPDRWIERIEAAADPRGLLSLAMDGETFGHHHRGGIEALARVLERFGPAAGRPGPAARPERAGSAGRPERANPERTSPERATERRRVGRRAAGARVRLENFAAFLARTPPVREVEIVSPSSWSCPHGVERWRSDCGCRMSAHEEIDLGWRAPLRAALEGLHDHIEDLYAAVAGRTFEDPERARGGYGAVLRADPASVDEYLTAAVTDPGRRGEARTLLDLVRDRGAMFTSCGWFFDDVSGLEPTQLLRYGAHAIDLAARLDPERAAAMEREFLGALAAARSNDPDVGDAARLYADEVRGAHPFAGAGT